MFPLREVPLGGPQGGIGFVNVPLNSAEVRSFKKEMKALLEDPLGLAEQFDQFLGPNVYTWEEMRSIMSILFTPEEQQMIRAAGMRIQERENQHGVPADQKMPLQNPQWDQNQPQGRQNMAGFRNLILRGIKEAALRGQNAARAFDSRQGKDKTPTEWLERLRKTMQQFSGIDPSGPVGQTVLKVNFVTHSWPDIQKKLEKLEDWQERGLQELLKEAQKVYVRRDEEKAKAKAKIMVASMKEANKGGVLRKGRGRDSTQRSGQGLLGKQQRRNQQDAQEHLTVIIVGLQGT